MGGGRSFGRQSGNVTKQSAPPARDAASPSTAPQQPMQPQPAGNRWFGPLAGLAAGLGIAALLSHFGLGGAFAEAFGSMILLALLVVAGVVVWRMLRGARASPMPAHRVEPAYSASAPVSTYEPRPVSAMPGSVASLSSSSTQNQPWGVPADFDTAAFIRSAKVNFIRLQAAWDAKNLADIREFTTPEVFGEIRMQLEEEKGKENHTDVLTLDAELLGIEESATDYLASVKFSASIREGEQGGPEPVEEVWNLVKPKEGRSGWLLAGIQQIH
jgi:predicted lipid-binding transport protein (Tim44 family)